MPRGNGISMMIGQFVEPSSQNLVTPLSLVPKPGRMVAGNSDIREEVATPQPPVPQKKSRRGGRGK